MFQRVSTTAVRSYDVGNLWRFFDIESFGSTAWVSLLFWVALIRVTLFWVSLIWVTTLHLPKPNLTWLLLSKTYCMEEIPILDSFQLYIIINIDIDIDIVFSWWWCIIITSSPTAILAHRTISPESFWMNYNHTDLLICRRT